MDEDELDQVLRDEEGEKQLRPWVRSGDFDSQELMRLWITKALLELPELLRPQVQVSMSVMTFQSGGGSYIVLLVLP